MKQRIQKFLLTALLLIGAWSCKKEDNKISLVSVSPVTLSASTTGPLVLKQSDSIKTAVAFSWNNPNYRFTTGISSQDVTYTLQIDTTGANFTSPSPNKGEVSISKDLSVTYNVRDLNLILGKMNLVENMAHKVEFRIKASINGSAPVYSNVISMTVTPYLDVVVPLPTAGTLWVVGDATGNGWSNPMTSPYDATQKFTKTSSTTYELTMNMVGDGGYKIIQQQGDWDQQYHALTGGTWSSGSFEKKNADPTFPGPPSAGTYKITLNFKAGTYTVVKQ